MEIKKEAFVKGLKMLSDNPHASFNNGKMDNKTAARKMIQIMRSRGYKYVQQSVLLAMVQAETKANNLFGVMYLTQFSVFIEMEYPGVIEINMGQVDKILRKYYA